MSSRQMEDRQEQQYAQKVASVLGISIDDLNVLVWEIDENTTEDGGFTGYNITFAEGSDPEILAQIAGLVDGRWIRVGPIN